mgnify:CR=1 FL=1
MRQLILIRGLSGSGKTTLARTICGDLGSRIMLSADDYFTSDDGSYNFDPNSLKEAHEWCKEQASSAFEDEYDVIVIHNTFTRKWEIDPYRELGEQHGYVVQILNLYDGGLSDRELSDRGVHNIPPYVIQKQRKRWDKDVYREKRPQQHSRNHNRGYDNRGYDNRGYDNRGYNNRGYDNRGYDNGYYHKKQPKW